MNRRIKCFVLFFFLLPYLKLLGCYKHVMSLQDMMHSSRSNNPPAYKVVWRKERVWTHGGINVGRIEFCSHSEPFTHRRSAQRGKKVKSGSKTWINVAPQSLRLSSIRPVFQRLRPRCSVLEFEFNLWPKKWIYLHSYQPDCSIRSRSWCLMFMVTS